MSTWSDHYPTDKLSDPSGDIADAITDFMAQRDFDPSVATELLDAAREEIRKLRKSALDLPERLTLREVLTRDLLAREWFKIHVIDQIDPTSPYAFRDRTKYEAILRLAEKTNPKPQSAMNDKPSGWGEF